MNDPVIEYLKEKYTSIENEICYAMIWKEDNVINSKITYKIENCPPFVKEKFVKNIKVIVCIKYPDNENFERFNMSEHLKKLIELGKEEGPKKSKLPEEVSIIGNKIFVNFQNLLVNIYTRWLNEKEHENFDDYKIVLKKEIDNIGMKQLTFDSLSKRPFQMTLRYKIDKQEIYLIYIKLTTKKISLTFGKVK